MRNDLTHTILVVDRSGSMDSIRQEAQSGINAFIADQKKVSSENDLTILQFDTDYDTVYRGNIQQAPVFVLEPRGMTALLDAVGRAITDKGVALEKLPEDQRPGCVMVVIVTDGHENASHEFTLAQIRAMIERQQTKYNWKFTFLGADAAAFDEGAAMGIVRAAVADYDPRNVGEVYLMASANVTRMRAAVAQGCGHDCAFGYTEEERKAMHGTDEAAAPAAAANQT